MKPQYNFSENKMNTHSNAIERNSLLYFFILLISIGCNSGTETSDVQIHEFEKANCDIISGTTNSAAETKTSGVDKIAYNATKESNQFTLKALNETEEEIGEATISYSVSQDIRRALITRVQFESETGSAEEITESFTNGSYVENKTLRRIADTESVIRWTLEGTQLLAASISVRSDLAVDGKKIFALPEGTFAVLEYMKNGEMIVEKEEISAFLNANGLNSIEEDPTYKTMKGLFSDTQWQDAATANVEACQAQVASDLATELSISSIEPCKKSSPFAKVIEIEAVLSVIGAGVVIGTALAVAGVPTLTALAAGIFIAFVLDKVASKLVDDGNFKRGFVGLIAGTAEVINPAANPSDATDFWAGPGTGKSTGDPHLTTFDGKGFSLQSAGEVIMVRSLDGTFELQSRQVPIGSSICGDVSINTAFALELSGTRVEYRIDRTPRLTVDGNPITPLSTPVEIAPRTWIISTPSNGIILNSPTGEIVYFRGGTGNSIFVRTPESKAGSYQGLLGNANGEIGDDFVGTNGPLQVPVSIEILLEEFVNQWRVNDQNSLFNYEAGESSMTYFLPDFPKTPTSVDNLPADIRSEAEAVCANVENEVEFSNCVFDVGCTGDPSFADAYFAKPAELVPMPIDYSDWTQTGTPSAGEWEITPDGRGVRQLTNGDPTFFVSSENYLNVQINGTMRVNAAGGDDDLIGFVFAYQDTASPTEIDAYVLAWKSFSQGPSPEGLRLLRVSGDYGSQIEPVFWDLTSPDVTILAESLGEGSGWRYDIDYEFELIYTTEKIEVRIDGVKRIELDASAFPEPAKEGHFGFYNYSQADTYYGDFLVRQL